MLTNRSRTTKQQPVPIDLAKFGERYAKAQNKQRDLIVRRRELQQKQGQIGAELAKLNGHAGQVDQAAMRLLESDRIDADPAEAKISLQDELKRARDEEAVVARAVVLIRDEIATARREASQVLCSELADTYRARVAAVGKALVELGRAHSDYVALTDEMESAGVHWVGTFEPMKMNFLGNPLNSQDKIPQWLRTAIARGYMDEADVPAEWRDAWGLSGYGGAPLRTEQLVARKHDARRKVEALERRLERINTSGIDATDLAQTEPGLVDERTGKVDQKKTATAIKRKIEGELTSAGKELAKREAEMAAHRNGKDN